MRYLVAIWVVIVLVGLLIVALINMNEYGVSGLILALVSAYALYKIYKLMFEGQDSEDPSDERMLRKSPSDTFDPLDYIMFSDLTDEWEE